MSLFGCGNDNNWLIWLIVLFFIFGNGNGCGCGCNNNNGCGNNDGCGCGCNGGFNDIILIVLIILLFAGGDCGLSGLFGSCGKTN